MGLGCLLGCSQCNNVINAYYVDVDIVAVTVAIAIVITRFPILGIRCLACMSSSTSIAAFPALSSQPLLYQQSAYMILLAPMVEAAKFAINIHYGLSQH